MCAHVMYVGGQMFPPAFRCTERNTTRPVFPMNVQIVSMCVYNAQAAGEIQLGVKGGCRLGVQGA